MDFFDILSVNAKALLREAEKKQAGFPECNQEVVAKPIVIEVRKEISEDQFMPEDITPLERIPDSLIMFETFFRSQSRKINEPLKIKTDRFGLAPFLFAEKEFADKYTHYFHRTILLQIRKQQEKIAVIPGENARKILKGKAEDNINMMVFTQRANEIRKAIEGLKTKPKNHMIYFVMYDIEDDKVRKRIADYLMEKGLTRVQKSIFLGETHQRAYRQIGVTLAEIQDSYDNHDSIFMVPTTEEQLKNMHIIGSGINFILSLHRTNTIFI